MHLAQNVHCSLKKSVMIAMGKWQSPMFGYFVNSTPVFVDFINVQYVQEKSNTFVFLYVTHGFWTNFMKLLVTIH